MRKVLTFASIMLVIAIVGCATFPMESKLSKPVSMTKMSREEGTHFVEEMHGFWLFWGGMPLVVPRVDDVVASYLVDHAGIQELKITTEHSFLDLVIDSLSGGFVYSKTITIEGKVYD